MVPKFYRYERGRTNGYLPFDELKLIEFSLVKETPKGNWICQGDTNFGLKRFNIWVSNTSRKRYAFPTKKEALDNYIIRTEYRVKYLKSDLETAQYMLKLAKKLVVEMVVVE